MHPWKSEPSAPSRVVKDIYIFIHKDIYIFIDISWKSACWSCFLFMCESCKSLQLCACVKDIYIFTYDIWYRREILNLAIFRVITDLLLALFFFVRLATNWSLPYLPSKMEISFSISGLRVFTRCSLFMCESCKSLQLCGAQASWTWNLFVFCTFNICTFIKRQ